MTADEEIGSQPIVEDDEIDYDDQFDDDDDLPDQLEPDDPAGIVPDEDDQDTTDGEDED